MEWWATWDETPVRDLASEEALLLAAAETGRPHLFAYGWNRPVLVLGYGQDPSEVNLAACRERGVAVVRRCSGGAGVLHAGDLTLSLALPVEHPWARSIGTLYDAFVTALKGGMENLGVHAVRGQITRKPGHRSPICFEDQLAETLLLDGKKVLGCAQTRRAGAVLVHGALLLGVNAGLQAAAYGVSREHIEALMGAVPRERYDSRETLAAHLARSLSRALGLSTCPPGTAPPLPPEWVGRLHDPKWVIIGSEE